MGVSVAGADHPRASDYHHWRVDVAAGSNKEADRQMVAPGGGQEEVRNSSEPPRGEVIRLEDDRAVLIAENLPAEPEDKVCQTWLLRDGVPEPAGTFESREGGITAAPIEGSLEGAAAVAVTVEPAGGSSAPTDDPLLSTNL